MEKPCFFLRFLYVFLIVVAFGLFGKTALDVMAEEQGSKQRYYTDITIQSGDTLWKIADQYCHDGNLSIYEYVQEIKKINHLKNDTIHTGQKLLIIYFSQDNILNKQRPLTNAK